MEGWKWGRIGRMGGRKEGRTEWREERKGGRKEESTGRKVGMLVRNDGKRAYFSILPSSIYMYMYFPLESADSSLFLI